MTNTRTCTFFVKLPNSDPNVPKMHYSDPNSTKLLSLIKIASERLIHMDMGRQKFINWKQTHPVGSKSYLAHQKRGFRIKIHRFKSKNASFNRWKRHALLQLFYVFQFRYQFRVLNCSNNLFNRIWVVYHHWAFFQMMINFDFLDFWKIHQHYL